MKKYFKNYLYKKKNNMKKLNRGAYKMLFAVFFLATIFFLIEIPVGQAQVVQFDFEDGRVPGVPSDTANYAKIRPKILTDSDGNHFLRITGSPEDSGSRFYTPAGRVRAELTVIAQPADMPIITDANRKQSYNLSVRLGENAPESTDIMQLYQYADGEPENAYGIRNGTGPTVWLSGKKDGSFKVRNYYNNENEFTELDLGILGTNKFINFTLNITWTNDPSVGRIDVLVNGVSKGSLTGKPTNLGPNSNHLPNPKIGPYGDQAAGSIDYDNIVVKQLSSSTPNPTPIPTPIECKSLNFINGFVSLTTVSPGGAYSIQCNYGANVDSIHARPGSGSCIFANFSGTTANFNCTAGTTSGTFANKCSVSSGTSSNTCAREDSINNITLSGTPPPSDTVAPAAPSGLRVR